MSAEVVELRPAPGPFSRALAEVFVDELREVLTVRTLMVTEVEALADVLGVRPSEVVQRAQDRLSRA